MLRVHNVTHKVGYFSKSQRHLYLGETFMCKFQRLELKN